MRILLLALLIGGLVVACGSGADTSTTVTSSAPTTTVAEATTTQAEATTTAAAETTTTAAEVDVTVTDGEVDGPDLFEYALGDQVELIVLVDVADEIHVHGYDIMFDAEPGIPVQISFKADAQGIFEVELEASRLPLFEIQVTP